MQGGFKASRYGSKFEEIKAAAQRDGSGEKKDPQVELKDAVQPLTQLQKDIADAAGWAASNA